MAISKVVVVDGNNLIVRIDRGVAGRGVTDVEPVVIDGSLYLVFTFSDGTTETVGPVGTIQYVGVAPIVVNGSTISLSTVPVNLGGTGQVTANAGFNALAPSQATNAGKYLKTDGTNSAWDLLDISTADITGTLPITNGGTGATTASGARTNLGLGTIATQNASAVSITGGTITGITDLAVADGGTGASTAAGARTNLNAADQATTLTAGTGLSGGGDLSANRTFSITNTGVTAAAYGSASNTLTATVNAQGQLTSLAATPIAIANTQISGLGTISTQDANAVAITGGSITGITDLAVADGGTGASDAAGARTNLNAANQATTITAGTGLSGGGDLSANRTINIANTTVTAAAYGSASNTLTATVNAQGQLTALAATPIAIANTQVSGLGTLSTQNSNAVTITGGSITGITDLAIADGGTGASNAADARSNLGLGSAAVLNAGVALGVATLDAGGTVPLSQIPASIQGGVSYQGAWNASTNTPTLTSSVGSKGYYYVVSVAGNTNLNGVTDWLVGDWAIFNGTAWEKIDNTDQVASVNGYTGVVVLSNTDVGAPPTSLTISAGTGLSGGGSLAANRTLSIANTTVTAAPYGTASAVPTFTVNGQGQLTAASDVTIAIANTQVSGLGTMSTQNANSVAITGGSITGITDLAVADGGTGASTAADARTNLSAAYNAITISAGTGLTGGGDLTANRTLAIDSSVVTLTGTQTLTNKTLTSPLINEILDTNGNEILGLSPTASATDFVTIKNGIGVGVPLHVYADGSSTNIGLHIQPKGSGLVTISDGTDFNKGIRFRSSGSAASAVTLLDAVATAGRVVTLPDATTTLVGRDTTDTLTNKTIAFGSNTFSGSLAIANGGTGQTTANAAFNALAPSQTGNSGKYLTTDGTDTSWALNPLGTVTSVSGTGTVSGISLSGTVTTSGNLTLGGALNLSTYNGAGAFTTLSASGRFEESADIRFMNEGFGIVNADNSARIMTFNNTSITTNVGIAVTGTGSYTGLLYLGGSAGTLAERLQVNRGTDDATQSSFLGYASLTMERAGAGVSSAGDFTFKVRGTTTVTPLSFNYAGVTVTGTLGIGLSNPNTTLHVKSTVAGSTNGMTLEYSGASSYYARLFSNGNDLYVSADTGNTGGKMFLQTAGTTAITVDASQNVGIGTILPVSLLDVSSGTNTTLSVPSGVVGKFKGSITLNSQSIASSGNIDSIYFQKSHTSGINISNYELGVIKSFTGNGFTGGLDFYTGKSIGGGNYAATFAMRIDENQNLGLGVTPNVWSASAKALQIGNGISLWSTANTNNFLSQNLYLDATSTYRWITANPATNFNQSNGAFSWQLAAGTPTAGGAIGSFSTYMTLDATGSLLVGATSQTATGEKFLVSGYAGVVSDSVKMGIYAGASGNKDLNFYSNGNSQFFTAARIRVTGGQTYTDEGFMAFWTTSNNGANVLTTSEKMRLMANGNLLVGLDSTYAACNGKISVISSSGSTATPTIAVLNPDASAAFVAFSDTATVFGSITRSVSAVLYNTTSDQRLKENIVDADSASNLIDSLQVRKFDWKADGNHQRYGFVAQELVTVAPEAVYQPNDADAMMAVDYSKLVPMLVKEIQSLRARVLQLETN